MSERDDEREDRLSKLRLKIRHDFEELDRLDTEALEAKIVECQANLLENARLEKTDRDLNAVKMKKTELEAPYKEGKKRLTSMMEYCTLRLEERGKDRTTETPEL